MSDYWKNKIDALLLSIALGVGGFVGQQVQTDQKPAACDCHCSCDHAESKPVNPHGELPNIDQEPVGDAL